MSSSLKNVRNPVVDRLMGKDSASAGLLPSNLRNDSYYIATHHVRNIFLNFLEFKMLIVFNLPGHVEWYPYAASTSPYAPPTEESQFCTSSTISIDHASHGSRWCRHHD